MNTINEMIREHIESSDQFDPDFDTIQSIVLTHRDDATDTYLVVVVFDDDDADTAQRAVVELIRVTVTTHTNPSQTILNATRVYLS